MHIKSTIMEHYLCIMIRSLNQIALLVLLSGCLSCQSQSNPNLMNEEKLSANPLLCDPVTGSCELPNGDSTETAGVTIPSQQKPLKVLYFTDPICSSCWGIEPQLRKLKLEYGDQIEIEYKMGGLLPDWSYNSGGISKPADVAHHWDEVSLHYDMPIDGDVWLEDPLHSSYPPSIAFKAAQMQDHKKALLFLREIREMVFLKKKNIAQWATLEVAAAKVDLDVKQLKTDFDGTAQALFEEDLKSSQANGVRGFPTMFFVDQTGKQETVYGSRAYAFYEMAILKLQPDAAKKEYRKDWETLFSHYHSLTAKEYSVLSGVPRAESEQALDELVSAGHLEKLTTKNGSLWTVKDAN